MYIGSDEPAVHLARHCTVDRINAILTADNFERSHMSRKSYWSLVVGVLAITALACADVQAQGRGRGGRGGGRGGPGGRGGFNVMQLLQVEQVHEEIELTEDQIASIKTAAEAQREGRAGRDRGDRGDRPNFREMSEEDRAKFFEEMRERGEKEAKESKEKIAEILLPHQMERLDEIGLQVQGAVALLNSDVAEKVGLAEEDVEKVKQTIATAQEGMRDKMRAMFGGGGGNRPDREALTEKIRELREGMNDEVLAVLSEDQRKKFEELQGEKFELPDNAFGRGFGRRGRGGPDGGGEGRRRRGGDRPQRPAEE